VARGRITRITAPRRCSCHKTQGRFGDFRPNGFVSERPDTIAAPRELTLSALKPSPKSQDLVWQTFEIRQILRPPAGRLVFPQTRQTDHRNHHILNLNHLFFGVTRFELNARNGGENLNPNRWHSHANHVIPRKKQAGGQLVSGKAELAKRLLNLGGSGLMLTQNIEIVGGSDMTINPDSVPNQQVFNTVRVEQLQELFEVPR
jgi:hypothetical protein